VAEKEWMPWISRQKVPLETGELVVQRVKEDRVDRVDMVEREQEREGEQYQPLQRLLGMSEIGNPELARLYRQGTLCATELPNKDEGVERNASISPVYFPWDTSIVLCEQRTNRERVNQRNSSSIRNP
jgi:hypothetical protein